MQLAPAVNDFVTSRLPPAVHTFLASPAVRDFQAWLTKPPFGPLNAVHEARLRGREWNRWAQPAYTLASLPLLLQGYLIVKPGTRPQRATLGVLGLAMYIPCWLEFRISDPGFNMANAGLTLYAFFVVAKYLEWSCLVGPLVDPRLLHNPAPTAKTRFLSALDLTTNFRNVGLGSIGLDHSLGPRNSKLKDYHYAHPRWRPRGPLGTVMRHVWAAVWRYAFADVVLAFMRTLGEDTLCAPGGHPNSIDAFISQWEGPQRIAAVIFATGLMATVTALYLGAAHHTIAAISVSTLYETSAWDFPIFNSPLLSTSINEMWSRRWQQVIRHYMAVQSMMVMAVLPRFLRGRVTYMLLVFHFSGLLHIIGHLGMEPVPDLFRIYAFFMVSGFGCVAERAFRSITGRRVRGVVGWIWTWTFLITSGRLISDAWLDVGFPVLYTRAPRLGLGDALVTAIGLTPK
ncbi:hypothetical protein CspeluHIS016_0500280 [Cutaneotrichosporon spelunceum]|uniref:Wax synthase domain-containing protein n=1 Tax=Cutaneotrichosporon spelunceum TaxID=1672016 RepID=A0AAD3YCE7_9TREE|nr:hypothetical protein CspeluHIS016_0500280 [Cutaneotrichosporon spelunceum]